MSRGLLSVDWDYFIEAEDLNDISFIDGQRSAVELWYRRYYKKRWLGRNIENEYILSSEYKFFWEKLEDYFVFDDDAQLYVSDSHALSYDVAAKNKISKVYLFDAHCDLSREIKHM